MNNKRIIKNIGISMMIKPVAMILSMVYIPLVLNFLGEEKYGVWTVLLSIISWINYFDIGIGKGVRNKLVMNISNENYADAKTTVSTGYITTMVLSTIFFIIFSICCLAFNIPEKFNLVLTDENSMLIILISIAFICMNFIFSLSREVMYSIHKPNSVSIINVLIQVANIIIIIIFKIFFPANLLVVAIMYGMTTLVFNIGLNIYIMLKYPYLKPSFGKFDKIVFQSMTSFGLLLFVQNICSLVLNTTDNLLISKYYGVESVTPYSIVLSVFNVILSIFNIILIPMWAEYTEAAEKGDYLGIKKQIKNINYLIVLFSLGCIILVPLFKPLAQIWLQRELDYPQYLIISMAVFSILNMIANNYNCVLQGIGEMKGGSLIAALSAILNIPLSLFLAINCGIGVTGILLGSACVMLLPVIFCPIFVYRWIDRMSKD